MTTPCGLRSRSRTPSTCSNPAMTADTEGVETPSFPPALAMLPESTTVKKTNRSRSFTRRPICSSQWIDPGIRNSVNMVEGNWEFPLIHLPSKVANNRTTHGQQPHHVLKQEFWLSCVSRSHSQELR